MSFHADAATHAPCGEPWKALGATQAGCRSVHSPCIPAACRAAHSVNSVPRISEANRAGGPHTAVAFVSPAHYAGPGSASGSEWLSYAPIRATSDFPASADEYGTGVKAGGGRERRLVGHCSLRSVEQARISEANSTRLRRGGPVGGPDWVGHPITGNLPASHGYQPTRGPRSPVW